jgi:hypothetical protein
LPLLSPLPLPLLLVIPEGDLLLPLPLFVFAVSLTTATDSIIVRRCGDLSHLPQMLPTINASRARGKRRDRVRFAFMTDV